MINCSNKYSCVKCNKIYKNRSGLWYHNDKIHKNNDHVNTQTYLIETQNNSIETQNNSINLNIKNKLQCKYCNKISSRIDNHNRHLKTCKEKKEVLDNETYKLQLQKLIEDFEVLKKELNNKKSIVVNNNILNNNCNNNSNNKTLNICQPGNEDIKLLSNNDKKFIMSQGMNSIISIVDKLNFNKELPQNHNFYVSAINDKHVNTIDMETKNIVKQSKKDLFDKILFNHMNKLEHISKNNSKFMDVFDKLKNFIYLKKGKKEFVNQLNMLSYNKRNIVIKTWNDLLDDNISADEATEKFETKVNELILSDKKPKEVIQLIETDSDSDTD